MEYNETRKDEGGPTQAPACYHSDHCVVYDHCVVCRYRVACIFDRWVLGGCHVILGDRHCDRVPDLLSRRLVMNNTDAKRLARQEGYRAFIEGVSISACPYTNEELKAEWQRGWKTAAQRRKALR